MQHSKIYPYPKTLIARTRHLKWICLNVAFHSKETQPDTQANGHCMTNALVGGCKIINNVCKPAQKQS